MKKSSMFKLFGFCMLAVVALAGCGGGTGGTSVSAAKTIVVTTNSPQFDSGVDETTQTVAGLDSPAYLLKGGSGQWASWSPGASGIYEIYAHIPPGTQIASNVYYKVSPDGNNTIFAKPFGTVEQDWVKLESADDKTVFSLNQDGYAFVYLSEDEEGFPLNVTSSNTDTNVTLPIDAMRFIRVDTASEGAVAQVSYSETQTQEEATIVTGADVFVYYSSHITMTAKSTAVGKATTSIFSIGGYSSGSSVIGAKWQGQPSSAPASATNKYKNYYAIDSKSDSSWTIKGAGFGAKQGVVTFSNSKISCKITSWKDNEIKLTPKVPYNFAYDSSVTLNIYVDNGTSCVFGASKNIPVVGLIKSRGYGQCTWYAAYKRLDNSKRIPDTAYGTKSIGTDYEPKKWDYLSYSLKHVAIIISDVAKSEWTDGDNKYKTYTFKIGEMNASWDESISTYSPATFEVKADKKGKKSITNPIGSGSSYSATGYYR